MPQKVFPRSNDKETVYLKNVISNPTIIIGDYTIYNDFVRDPKDFEKNNVLYHYPLFPPIRSRYFIKNGVQM